MSGIRRENEWWLGEKMSNKGEKMSGDYLPLYVVKKGKTHTNQCATSIWCHGGIERN